MRSAIVPIFKSWRRANLIRSSRRAIAPSSFKISTMTAAGSRPASRARSQPASVWPARVSTPPGCAINGKMWPGWRKSLGCAPGAAAAWMVRARSCAEIPVVTPSAASIEIVKFVVWCTSVLLTINGNRSCSQRVRVNVRQMRPRPYLAMKLTSSARTFVAAMTRSPSFSRSSSSRMTTISPARIAATMSSVEFS